MLGFHISLLLAFLPLSISLLVSLVFSSRLLSARWGFFSSVDGDGFESITHTHTLTSQEPFMKMQEEEEDESVSGGRGGSKEQRQQQQQQKQLPAIY